MDSRKSNDELGLEPGHTYLLATGATVDVIARSKERIKLSIHDTDDWGPYWLPAGAWDADYRKGSIEEVDQFA